MSEFIHNTSDAAFEADVLQSNIPVLVDFWADWCAPCKAIAPILESIAPDYHGKLKIVKVDVVANKQTPAQFGIRGIPSLLIFKNGQLVGTQVGLVNRDQLSAFIDKHIA